MEKEKNKNKLLGGVFIIHARQCKNEKNFSYKPNR